MARLRYIRFSSHRCTVEGNRVEWVSQLDRDPIQGLPQIIWNDSRPWREANLWALQRAREKLVSIETVRSNMTSILMYANWLESNEIEWWSFPVKKADRCLVRYRGHLIHARDADLIAPSTATQRMRDAINFYRWLNATGLLSPEWPMWKDRHIGVHLTDAVGFQRTITVQTTDLAIKNRKANVERLEDGLLPVSSIDRDLILEFAIKNSSWEMFLLLTLGFYTGMRLGTLCDLKVETIERATEEPGIPGLYKLAIGPGARPSVKTKFGVTGFAWITHAHLTTLKNYIESVRRQDRVSKATVENKCLVFLTKYGNPYTSTKSERSSAINVEMNNLRNKGVNSGISALQQFKFHQTRCTFATQLAYLLMPVAGAINALAIIKEALSHKDEATSLKYIKFVERSPAKAVAANAFTLAFLGVLSTLEKPNDQ